MSTLPIAQVNRLLILLPKCGFSYIPTIQPSLCNDIDVIHYIQIILLVPILLEPNIIHMYVNRISTY